jgi:hypothetical protein
MNEAHSPTITGPVPSTAPRDVPRTRGRLRDLARADDLLFLVTGLASAGTWYALYRWYGLLANRDNTHFAFEKIPGGWESAVIRRTALLFLALAALYGITAWLIATAPRLTVAGKALLATGILAAGIGNVLLYPVGALDVFNYMIELKLAYHFDQNPYLVTFVNYRSDPFALPAFLVDVRLFYGPAWLLVSWLPGAIVGYESVIRLLAALKVLNLALIGATAWLIAAGQIDRQRRWLAAYLFAANPLVLFEGVANGHNEVLLTLFLVAAFISARRRSPVTGPLFALSVMVKFYPLVVGPLIGLVASMRRWSLQRLALSLVLTAATVVACVAPFWAEGEMPGGLRRGLNDSQAMDHVSLSSLARQREQQRIAERSRAPEIIKSRPSAEILPSSFVDRLRWIGITIMTVTLALLGWAVLRGYPVERAGAEALLVFFLLFTNLYPWYLIPVVALLALGTDRLSRLYLVAATALGLVYYPMYVYGHFSSGYDRYHTHLFLALFLTAPILVYLALRAIQGALTLRRRHFFAFAE